MDTISIEGLVDRPGELGYADLMALPGQVPELGAILPGREGTGVRLTALLAHAGLGPAATHLTIASDDGSFQATVPLDGVQDAVLAYRLGDEPYPRRFGGPVRFLIPDAASCKTAAVDACANVKFVGRLVVGEAPPSATRDD